MGMTITEKILAAHAGKKQVEPGEYIYCDVDMVMAHDDSGPPAIEMLQEMEIERVFDPNKLVLVQDHNVPPRDMFVAKNTKALRDFARAQGVTNYFEMGRSGICHVIVPESGLVVPGDLMVGGDSHTVTCGAVGAFATGLGHLEIASVWALGQAWFRVPESIKLVYRGKLSPWVMGKDLILFTLREIGEAGARYKTMEFAGEAIANLPMDSRFTLSNMSIEAGAKNGIIPPDEVTLKYVKARAKKPYKVYQSDPDAKYAGVYEWDVSNLKPLVAVPPSPANVKPVNELNGVKVDQAFIGTCTNGRFEDMVVAAKILKGRKVHPGVRLIVIPASHNVLVEATKAGLVEIFAEAGALVESSTCGPCNGLHMGVMDAGEVCIASNNRNFTGRMGHQDSKVYLANPAVVAASAVMGRIASPEEVLGA